MEWKRAPRRVSRVGKWKIIMDHRAQTAPERQWYKGVRGRLTHRVPSALKSRNAGTRQAPRTTCGRGRAPTVAGAPRPLSSEPSPHLFLVHIPRPPRPPNGNFAVNNNPQAFGAAKQAHRLWNTRRTTLAPADSPIVTCTPHEFTAVQAKPISAAFSSRPSQVHRVLSVSASKPLSAIAVTRLEPGPRRPRCPPDAVRRSTSTSSASRDGMFSPCSPHASRN